MNSPLQWFGSGAPAAVQRCPVTRLAFVLTALLLTALLGMGCSGRPPQQVERPVSHGFAEPESTPLGQIFGPLAQRHPNQSGVLLLDLSEESLLWRGALIEEAERAIDAQYFLWGQDNIGILAASHLLAAAQRGVRVRILVDDFYLESSTRHLELLDAHPKVEIRLYNPFLTRTSSALLRSFEILGDFKRLNRRMHNKVMLVDGAVAIVGGRNVADPYFDMHDAFNYRDRDVLAIGPVVAAIGASFDAYWNSPWSVPVRAVAASRAAVPAEERDALYHRLLAYRDDPQNLPARYAQMLNERREELNRLPSRLTWARAEVIYDRPGKNDDPDRLDAFGRTGARLTELALATERELIAETPYLVFLTGTFEVVASLRERGVRISILTNSLASTDMVIAFNAYARQRERILALGVELYELRPDAASRRDLIRRFDHLQDDSKLTLHAKTVVFDRTHVLIGTFNMDPRSTHLNTEIALLVHSPAFAEQVLAALERDFAAENAWRLMLDDQGAVLWYSAERDAFVHHEGEPNVGFWRSLKSFLLSPLSLESII